MLVNVTAQVEVSREFAERCMLQTGADNPMRAAEAVLVRKLTEFATEDEPTRSPPPRKPSRRRPAGR